MSAASPNAPPTGIKDAESRDMKHICWDGCMVDNSVLKVMMGVEVVR